MKENVITLESLINVLPFNPSWDQEECLKKMANFLNDDEAKVFILSGPPGSGKTCIIKTIIEQGIKCFLGASTGRASKVVRSTTNRVCRTLHKIMYKVKFQNGIPMFMLKENENSKGIFIIDEASMVQSEYNGNNLSGESVLEDLITFVTKYPENKLIFIGDSNQLPPVGEETSVALSKEMVEKYYELKCDGKKLKEIHRQSKDSGIYKLYQALQKAIDKNQETFNVKEFINGKDVQLISWDEFYPTYKADLEGHTFRRMNCITATNKEAHFINESIRKNVYGYSSEHSIGDRLMIVQNNYFHKSSKTGISILANGEGCTIKNIVGAPEQFGGEFKGNIYKPFIFQDAEINVINDFNCPTTIRTKLLLNPIYDDSTCLSQRDSKRFYYVCRNRMREEGINIDSAPYLIHKDPYFNALKVKYGYAVTCHKAQGGQWNIVYVDIDSWYKKGCDLNWLLTAVTRAKEKLYLIC